MKNLTNKILLSLFFLCFAGTAKSQATFSLLDAIEIALKNNFQIEIAKKEIEQNVNSNTIGNAGALPRLDLRVSQNQTFQEQNNPNSVLQGTIFTANTSPTLELQWEIFNGFLAKANKQIFDKMVDLSLNNEQLVIQNTIHSVSLAYFQCILEKDKLDVFRSTLTFSADKKRRAVFRYELGNYSSIESKQAVSNYYTDSINYINQLQIVGNATRNLNRLLQVDLEKQHVFPNSFPKLDISINKDSVMANYIQNIDLKSILINEQILAGQLKATKSNLYPTLTTNLGYNLNSTYVNSDFFTGTAPLSWQGYFNFTLNFNLFNGGKTRIAIKNAQTDLEINKLNERDLGLSVKNKILNQYYQYENLVTLIDIQKKMLAINRSQLEQAEQKADLGTINTFDLREVQLSLLKNELNLLINQFNLIQTYLELEKLQGILNLEKIVSLVEN